MAERLGYVERGGLRAVERFMKHYFLVAKDVGDLTTVLCAALELEQVKPSPIAHLFSPLSWRPRRRSLRLIGDELRGDPEANRIFLELLCSEKDPEPTLRRMNEAGVLGRF